MDIFNLFLSKFKQYNILEKFQLMNENVLETIGQINRISLVIDFRKHCF